MEDRQSWELSVPGGDGLRGTTVEERNIPFWISLWHMEVSALLCPTTLATSEGLKHILLFKETYIYLLLVSLGHKDTINCAGMTNTKRDRVQTARDHCAE
jgi:hypothetical protein